MIVEVTWAERNRLLGRTADNCAPSHDAKGHPIYNTPLIKPHPRRSHIYIALVEAAVIRAELRREIKNRVPMAEDNKTVRYVSWASDKAAGRYIEHDMRRSMAYISPDRETVNTVRRRSDNGINQTAPTSLNVPLRNTEQVA